MDFMNQNNRLHEIRIRLCVAHFIKKLWTRFKTKEPRKNYLTELDSLNLNNDIMMISIYVCSHNNIYLQNAHTNYALNTPATYITFVVPITIYRIAVLCCYFLLQKEAHSASDSISAFSYHHHIPDYSSRNTHNVSFAYNIAARLFTWPSFLFWHVKQVLLSLFASIKRGCLKQEKILWWG